MNQNNWEESESQGETLDTLQSETKQTPSESKEESGLGAILGECLTFAPLLYERFTKKKLPAMGGTIGEMQQAITQLVASYQQLHLGIQTIVNNQTKIFNRINSLESNASRRLLNLDDRIKNLSGVRLTHEREKKQIEYSNNSSLEKPSFNNSANSSEDEQY